MGIFDSFNDTPSQIKFEGQEIDLKFIRLDDNTGKLTWNIPPSIDGCSGDGVYDGIVLTVSRKPADYQTTSPKDGQYYIGDPTVDPDLHSGSKITDDVLVVGAFYNDRETTELEITDLQPRTAYYFSAYAVDNVARYHREGVHSYSLPTGPEEGPEDEETSAEQAIKLEDEIRLTQSTGLNADSVYDLKLNINDCEYTIEILGSSARTYESLIKSINKQLTFLEDGIYQSPTYPYNETVWTDGTSFYFWDGQNKTTLDVIKNDIAPNLLPSDTLWYDTDDKILYRYNGPLVSAGTEWSELEHITYQFDITKPKSGQIWFNPATGVARIRKNKTWCKINAVVSSRNPLLPQIDTDECAYWYNTETGSLSMLNIDSKTWEDIDAIYFNKDPNDFDVGDYWYNDQEDKLYVLQSGLDWFHVKHLLVEEVDSSLTQRLIYRFVKDERNLYVWNTSLNVWDRTPVIINNVDPNADDSVQDATLGDFWFDDEDEILYRLESSGWVKKDNVVVEETNSYIDSPYDIRYAKDSQRLYEWSSITLSWEELPVAVFPSDPRDRESCQYWWDSISDKLFIWDDLNGEWVEVDLFLQQSTDPLAPQKLPENTIWYNPETGSVLKILSTSCEEVEAVVEEFDPTNPPPDLYWLFDGKFFLYSESLGEWVEVSNQPIFSDTDPTIVNVGTYWFSQTISKLFRWDGANWVEVQFQLKDPKPDEGFLWYNTVSEKLYRWNIDKWVEELPIAYVEFVKGSKCGEKHDKFVFKTRKKGCDAIIEIMRSNNNVFGEINVPVRYCLSRPGQDIQRKGPMHSVIGVGDDGSPDERRDLHRRIRELLGEPSTKVELTKRQIDTCIDNAIQMLRKYSGYAYTRGLFFLDLRRNQQTYELVDKCVGFNKIVKVYNVYKSRKHFWTGSSINNDILGYAALQQLYHMGKFDILSYHLVSSYLEELEHIFASKLRFQWSEYSRELKFYNSIDVDQRVLVDASLERPEQQLITDRNTSMWLQKWALAEAKMMLSQGRGKYQSLPGPSGSTVLNAQELITQSEAEKAALLEELYDVSMWAGEEVGQDVYFVMG